MAKSIRISDSLYETALAHSGLASRSLAQQIEHWAKLGAALEHQQPIEAKLHAPRFTLAAHETMVRSGKLAPEALHAIPAAFARQARVTYPKPSTSRARRSW